MPKINFKLRKKMLIWVILLLASIGTVITAGAAAITINTNDGNVDTNWIPPLYVDTDNNPALDDDKEIKSAWIGSDGNGASANNIYFRIETYSGAAISNNYAGVAALDCNQSGSTADGNPDRRILYNTQYDFVSLRFPNNGYAGSQCDGSPPSNPPCNDGERTTTPTNANVEWVLSNISALPSGNDETFPADCRDQIDLSFAIANATSGAVYDQTPIISGFNIPTVVDMTELSSGNNPSYSSWIIGVFGLVAASALFSCSWD